MCGPQQGVDCGTDAACVLPTAWHRRTKQRGGHALSLSPLKRGFSGGSGGGGSSEEGHLSWTGEAWAWESTCSVHRLGISSTTPSVCSASSTSTRRLTSRAIMNVWIVRVLYNQIRKGYDLGPSGNENSHCWTAIWFTCIFFFKTYSLLGPPVLLFFASL